MSFESARDEIEEIIKRDNIDRSRFGEFSKFKYDEIIKKFLPERMGCKGPRQGVK